MCPTGYEAKDGDVAGGGLSGSYSASLEKCKADCDAKSECNSFVHSMSGNLCKLLAEAEPTQPKYQDGKFCKKIMIGTCVYEWHAWKLLYHYADISDYYDFYYLKLMHYVYVYDVLITGANLAAVTTIFQKMTKNLEKDL